jgi:hypothetical protein
MCNKCLGTIEGDGDGYIATVDGEATDDDLFDDLGNPLEEYD